MKWALAQLRKLDKPIIIDETLDFSEDIKSLSDVLKVSPFHVTGMGYEMGEDEYVFALDVSGEMLLQCAITLEEVPYEMNFHVDEVFARTAEEDDDINLIDGETIDLVPVILSDIIVNKPMRITKKGAIYESEKAEKKINPAFAELKDLFKN